MLDQAERRLQRRKLGEALQAFDEAEAAGADRDRCAGGGWLVRMLSGDFGGAWRESDAIRARGGEDAHRFWNGEDLRGKRVILRCLHGFGDAVQMLRYAPRLKAMCARLIVEVSPRFAELARCFTGVDEVVTWEQDAPEWDAQVEVMELPYLFRTEIAELPLAERYLEVPGTVRAQVSDAMGERQRPRIGIVWAAGEWNPARNLPFHLMKRLVGGCEFWSLQGGVEQARWSELRSEGLRDAAECGEGLLTLAAVIAELDLVITVDTLAAHLAGALGTPAWVMLQYAADWRWMTGREDSPWYPSLRLFRQSSAGDWEGVVETVRGCLEAWAAERSEAVLAGARA